MAGTYALAVPLIIGWGVRPCLVPTDYTGRLWDLGCAAVQSCCVHAFTFVVCACLAQAGPQCKDATVAANRRKLLSVTGEAKRQHARNAACAWLREHGRLEIWDGLQIEGLVFYVSGQRLDDYLRSMQQNRIWMDTALLHGMACAFGADACVFQEGVDPALLGVSLHEPTDVAHDSLIVVPIALVNDKHFWGVVAADTVNAAPVEEPPLQLVPWSVDGPPRKRQRVDEGGEEEAEEDPNPCSHVHDTEGKETNAASGYHVEVELQLCHALSRWDPWGTPPNEILAAMSAFAGAESLANPGEACLGRSEAMQELAYEEAHADTMPDMLKYQRLAKYRLLHPCKGKRLMRKDRRVVIQTVLDASAATDRKNIANVLEQTCNRWTVPHIPGNNDCPGLKNFPLQAGIEEYLRTP